MCAQVTRAHDLAALAMRNGHWRATLVSPHEPADGVRIMPLPGRVPGMFLETSGPDAVVVFGRYGEPFLRFTPQGVDANQRSPLWIENDRARGASIAGEGDPKSPPDWRRVRETPRFAWIEFRAWPGTDEPGSTSRVAWSIPMRIGERSIVLVGLTTWEATP